MNLPARFHTVLAAMVAFVLTTLVPVLGVVNRTTADPQDFGAHVVLP